MCYKSIVNELDKFLIKKSDTDLDCESCPLDDLKADISFANRLRMEFNIESDCIINFFYSIKDILSEHKMNFLLEKLKENKVRFINCGYYYKDGSSNCSSKFMGILKNACVNLLEIE